MSSFTANFMRNLMLFSYTEIDGLVENEEALGFRVACYMF